MYRVWLGVDLGAPVRKQTRHHVARVAREGILLWIRAKLPVRALVSGLESIRAFWSESEHGSNFVQSYFVRILAYGTWLRCNINAPCLAWGRFGRSRQKTNTASCVNSAMIEGMRYKVYLLLQGRVVHPVMDMDRALRACTVPALKSIRELRSDNKHGIMRLLCDDRTSRRVPEWT